MERKTFIDNDGFYIDGINGKVWSDMRGRFRGKAIDRLAAYEDTGLEPDTIKNWMLTQDLIDSGITPAIIGTPLKHLFELSKAEAEGHLVVLPCKVGDTVFYAFENEDVFCGKVYAISTCDGTNWFSVRYDSGLRYDHTWDEIGKTVFLTREEAEAKLKEEEE